MKTGAAGRWFVTPHALDRYREHVRSDSPGGALLRRLLTEAEKAHFVKALDNGPQLWRGPPPRRLRFIVSVCSDGTLPSLITVRGAFDRRRD